MNSSKIKDAKKILDDLAEELNKLTERDNFDDSKIKDSASGIGPSPDDFIKRTVSKITSDYGVGISRK